MYRQRDTYYSIGKYSLVYTILVVSCLTAFAIDETKSNKHRQTSTLLPPPTSPSFYGYYTFEEAETELRALRDAAPQYIPVLGTLGKSIEKRDILVACIGACDKDAFPGDLFDVPPSTRTLSGLSARNYNATRSLASRHDAIQGIPATLFTALHHSREPLGMMLSFRFIRELIESALRGDTSSISLLSQRQLWFIPMVNPDGYVWNIDNDKNCQGRCMERKNRRREPGCNNQGASLGVDLNRNYDYKFDDDEIGSVGPHSGAGYCDEIYRGTAPFSEPETNAVKKLVDVIEFEIALHWHSYGQVVNVPFSHAGSGQPPKDDFSMFVGLAEAFARTNGFDYGSASHNGLYSVNGDAADYMYAKHGIFAFSPEVGPYFKLMPFWSGMWPREDTIHSLETESLPIAAQSLWRSGAFLEVNIHTGYIQRTKTSTTVYIKISIDNGGTRLTNGRVLVSLLSQNSYEQIIHDSSDCTLRRAGYINGQQSTSRSRTILRQTTTETTNLRQMAATDTTSVRQMAATDSNCDNAKCSDQLWLQYLYDTRGTHTWVSTSYKPDGSCALDKPSLCGHDRMLLKSSLNVDTTRRQLKVSDQTPKKINVFNEPVYVTSFAPLARNSSSDIITMQLELNSNEPEQSGILIVSDARLCALYRIVVTSDNQLTFSKFALRGQTHCLPCSRLRYMLSEKKESNSSTCSELNSKKLLDDSATDDDLPMNSDDTCHVHTDTQNMKTWLIESMPLEQLTLSNANEFDLDQDNTKNDSNNDQKDTTDKVTDTNIIYADPDTENWIHYGWTSFGILLACSCLIIVCGYRIRLKRRRQETLAAMAATAVPVSSNNRMNSNPMRQSASRFTDAPSDNHTRTEQSQTYHDDAGETNVMAEYDETDDESDIDLDEVVV